MKSSEAVPLFPSFVWKTQLHDEVYQRINTNMHRALQRLTSGMPEVPPAGKWQTDQTLHQLAEFAEFCAIVLSAIW